ncbi:hypothetical protein EGW08_021203 [Elysia chlorotica]|uniref:Uncharacterized protein n=1 Tax=Elysia chlorotica TaxID=188477 RepID=A0A433SPG2_ELYCH|nr:hypothetical protein EGW08_021203 [Elysia chlorotica]
MTESQKVALVRKYLGCSVQDEFACYPAESGDSMVRESLIFLSDNIGHDHHAVQDFTHRSIDILRQKMSIKKLTIWRDGAASQYLYKKVHTRRQHRSHRAWRGCANHPWLRKYRQFQALGQYVLQARRLACFCSACRENKPAQCLNVDYYTVHKCKPSTITQLNQGFLEAPEAEDNSSTFSSATPSAVATKDRHWDQKEWPVRTSLTVGEKNVINEPLVDRARIVFPPLHIKLGLMKQFVKALDTDGECFKYLCEAFPGVTYEKLKAGIFDGPQIRKLIKDTSFVRSIKSAEKNAWESFVSVVREFLGNRRSENYKELVQNMLEKYCALGCNMSIKVHFLHSHLDRFPENLGDVSDEQGERFHQDLKVMEDRYQGRWDIHMMADYCWSIQRDCVGKKHSRKSLKRKFVPE